MRKHLGNRVFHFVISESLVVAHPATLPTAQGALTEEREK